MYHYNSNNSNSNNSSIISSKLPRNTTHLPLHPALLVKPVEQGIVELLVVSAEVATPAETQAAAAAGVLAKAVPPSPQITVRLTAHRGSVENTLN